MKTVLLSLITGFCTFTSLAAQVTSNDHLQKRAERICDSIRTTYLPDKRVGIFQTEFRLNGSHLVLTGNTTLPDASQALQASLQKAGFEVEGNLRLLPDTEELGEKTWGVVNMSVCNMRSAPDYDAGQSTQALLGMPVKIIEKDGWLHVQTPDEYLSWVLPASIQRMTRAELSEWNRSPQIVVTDIYGFVYSQASEKSQTVSDVVSCNRLKYLGKKGKFYEVGYTDGRRGFLPKRSGQPLDEWRKNIKHDAESILNSGRLLIGVPYMWSGTSTKGVDCSGFVRTTLLMHDIIIPRDASQQALKGQRIEIEEGFKNLQPGDLLLFGTKAQNGKRERVSHVGFYTNNGRFIHSLGWVKEASFNPEDPDYDAYDLNRLLFAVRILPFINQEKGLNTTDQNEFYH